MGRHLRGGDVRAARQTLDALKIGPALLGVGGKAVAQGVQGG
jgi:hypothetical protein